MTNAIMTCYGTSESGVFSFGAGFAGCNSATSLFNFPPKKIISEGHSQGLKKIGYLDLNQQNTKIVGRSLEKIYLKRIDDFLTSFRISNKVYEEQKVRSFLAENKFVIRRRLENLVNAAFLECGDKITGANIRLLSDEDGFKNQIYVEFCLSPKLNVREKINIDDEFKIENHRYLSDRKLGFDFI